MPTKKLTRSRNNKMIAGVAAGIAEYFGIDVSIARLLWLLTLIPGGIPGFLLYIICWVIIPEE